MIALYKGEKSYIFCMARNAKNVDVSDIAERRKYNERNERERS